MVRAVEARRYNREYDAAQTTHQNNINRADEIAIGATEAGVDGGVELATDAGKRVSARVRDAINSGKTYVRQVGEEGPSSLPDNGVFHIAGATR